MIALLSGILKRNAADYLIIDVGGVGYQVQAPLSTVSGLPGVGEDVTLHIYTHVREDSLLLFGFMTESEKEMFLLLLGVSGIGPRIALTVLSCLSVSDIALSLYASDDAKLCTIPGIGKKTAARLVLELKDKIKHLTLAQMQQNRTDAGSDQFEDAVSALVNLGYKKAQAEEALDKVRQGRPGLGVQTLIREALGVLLKK